MGDVELLAPKEPRFRGISGPDSGEELIELGVRPPPPLIEEGSRRKKPPGDEERGGRGELVAEEDELTPGKLPVYDPAIRLSASDNCDLVVTGRVTDEGEVPPAPTEGDDLPPVEERKADEPRPKGAESVGRESIIWRNSLISASSSMETLDTDMKLCGNVNSS